MSVYLSFLTALGWSLLYSIWQMAVLWIAYSLLTGGNNRISPAGKHNLVLVFVFVGTEWFIYTFIRLLNQPAPDFNNGFISLSPSVNSWLPFGSSVYLLVLAIRFVQYTLHHKEKIRHINGRESSPAYQLFADRYARLLGITKRVQVYLSDLADTAETSGFFKPIVLLPVSLITRLSPQQLEAIIVHELFHIRRNDYLINICMSCFKSIFFFNPFARLFYKAMARERELACDDGVIETGFEPAIYAEALFSLEKFRQVQPGFALAADGNKPWLLMERIGRLLGRPSIPKKNFNPLFYFILIMSVTLSGIRQKAPVSEKALQSPVPPAAVIPNRYELAAGKISLSVPEAISTSAGFRKTVKKQLQRIAPCEPVPETEEESVPVEQAIFADNKIERDYSNQAAAALTQDAVPESPGSPYVPAASLYYEALPVIIADDSMKTIAIQNGLKDMVRISRMKSIAGLKALEIEIEKNKELLNREVIKNRELIILNQKNLKPELEKIRRQIEVRKKKVEHLRIRMQDSEEEIIHI